MKNKNKRLKSRMLSGLTALCVTASIGAVPVWAYEPEEVTAGDIVYGFDGYTSDDPSIAWVDENGALRALKAGTVTLRADGSERTIPIKEYDDDSQVVGQLKILARYNDSMQFYDGHVYLLFTSYKDNVEITVNDLYAGYEISDDYYYDIRDSISNGSNHTGTDTEPYFTFDDSMNSVTLDKGEIVTIGMYRDFDLTVQQAALGALKNSSMWGNISDAAKTDIINTIWSVADKRSIGDESALGELIKKLEKENIDISSLLDGVVDGGVCFNRELYNQKLEWDQYENVTYEVDITEKQLENMTASLQGNLNIFSMLKNSCVTAALRAWNAAVGTRDGEDTAYHLEPSGEGIFSYIDAPKTAKDEIIKKLPGYYLNNADGVQEPDAGYQDETGWVYVSAPEADIPGGIDTSAETPALTVRITGDAIHETTVYRKSESGEEIFIPTDKVTELDEGTEVFVRTSLADEDYCHLLKNISLGTESLMDSYDEKENAYRFVMPAKKTTLRITYAEARVETLKNIFIQAGAGDKLDIKDFAALYLDSENVGSDDLSWDVFYTYPDGAAVIENDGRTIYFTEPCQGSLTVNCNSNKNVNNQYIIEVYDNIDNMANVKYNVEGTVNVNFNKSEDEMFEDCLPYSDYFVPKGTKLRVEPEIMEPSVLSKFTVNGKNADISEPISVDADTTIDIAFRPAVIKGMPGMIRLDSKDDSYVFDAKVKYSELKYTLLPVFDQSVTYVSSDPLVSVDANGKLTVNGEIPEEGKCVIITAYAGSSFNSVKAQAKVILGDYAGARPVGRLTISARRPSQNQLIAHGVVTYTAYEDTDFDVSYYNFYKPEQKYIDMMEDYKEHPEKYQGDPALLNGADGIENRPSYFSVSHNEEGKTSKISLQAGEGMTITNYGYSSTNIQQVLDSLQTSSIAQNNENVSKLIEQMRYYIENGRIDDPTAFDNTLNVLMQAYMIVSITGHNPIDGHAPGGLDINREVYNQFIRTDTQVPNNYYTVEVTAEELDALKAYLASPENNYYSVFDKNCATGAVDAWNSTFFDRPDIQIKGNYTNFCVDPISLYIELGLMRMETGKTFSGTGEGGGVDFVPHIASAYDPAENSMPMPKLGMIYNGEAMELAFPPAEPNGTVIYALSDSDTAPADGWSEEIPTAVNAGTYRVWYRIADDTGYSEYEGGARYLETAIAPAEITAIAEDVTVSYDGASHGINVRVDEPAAGFTVTYGTEEDDFTMTECPVFTEVGEYVVYFKVTADNYNTYIGSAAVTITEADISAPTKGDVNASGRIDVTDIVLAAAHVKGIRALDADALARADVNDDNKLNVSDVALIAAHVKGIRPLK